MDSNSLLSDVFANEYVPRKLRSASPKTLALWRVALRHFNRFTARPATVADLNDLHVCGFAMWRKAEGVQNATINRDLASLLALWRWLHRRGIVNVWPDVELAPEPKRTPVAWTEDEFNALMRAARRAEGNFREVPAKLFWPALLLTCFDTGERIGAILSLRWKDLDLPGCWVNFTAETRKGGREDSLVRIAPDTVAAIEALPKVARLVFPWHMTRTYLWAHMADLLESAGLPNDRSRKFHCIRRTTASHAEAAGGNATLFLRHAARTNTEHYLDPRITKPQQAIDHLWRPR